MSLRAHFLPVLLALASAPQAVAVEQPNVGFILADDLGREDCGFMGGKEIKTPNIDKIAATGARLNAFYVTGSTAPARAHGPDDPNGAPLKKKAADKESVELFNLKDDPFEKTNLAEKHPDRVKELQGKLAAFAKQAVPPKAKPKPVDFVTPKVWGEKD
jgi:hypothetical protein